MRGRRKRSPLRIVLWCIVVAVVVVCVIGTLALSPPPVPDPIAAVPPPQLAAGRARVERAIAQVRQPPSSASDPHRPFSVSLTDRDLNAFLATDPRALHAMAKRGVEWARVKLGDGDVTMVALARVGRRRIAATITGTLAPSGGGRILFRPTGVAVGRLGLPGPLASRIAAEIERRLPDEAYRVRGEVTKVEVTPGHLLIEGTAGADDNLQRDDEASP